MTDQPSVLFVCVHNAGRVDAVKASDVVITIGCCDTCPIFAGKRYEDWDLADPAGQGLEAVRLIRDQIRAHVTSLLGELGVPVSDTTPERTTDADSAAASRRR